MPVPSKLTPVAVTSPAKAIVRPVANAVAVDAFPVTAPVTSPSMSATNVPFAYPVPLVFTVVVGSACKLLNSFH